MNEDIQVGDWVKSLIDQGKVVKGRSYKVTGAWASGNVFIDVGAGCEYGMWSHEVTLMPSPSSIDDHVNILEPENFQHSEETRVYRDCPTCFNKGFFLDMCLCCKRPSQVGSN